MCVLLFSLLAAIFPIAETVNCHHSLRNSVFNHTFDSCKGDICYLLKDDENGLSIQGCVQGIPGLVQQLQHQDLKWAWLCDSDLCNGDLPKSLAINVGTDLPASTCLMNATTGSSCQAQKCWYQSEKLLEQPGKTMTDERHSCKSFTGNPSYRLMLGQLTDLFMPNACYYTLSDRDAAGEMLGQTVCSCSGDNCNREPGYDANEDISLVICRMSPQSAQSDVDIGATCMGQYCYLQRATMNGYDAPIEFYTKGCFNATGAREYLDIGYRRFDQATSSEETWVCDWNDCNKNLQEAAKANHTVKAQAKVTSVAPLVSSSNAGTLSSSAGNQSLPSSAIFTATLEPMTSSSSIDQSPSTAIFTATLEPLTSSSSIDQSPSTATGTVPIDTVPTALMNHTATQEILSTTTRNATVNATTGSTGTSVPPTGVIDATSSAPELPAVSTDFGPKKNGSQMTVFDLIFARKSCSVVSFSQSAAILSIMITLYCSLL